MPIIGCLSNYRCPLLWQHRADTNTGMPMRSLLIVAIAASYAIVPFTASRAAVKEVSYPAVNVELAEVYKPDAAFEQMRKFFAEAVAKRDTQALFSLVGPTFVWTSQGAISEHLD